MTHHPADQGSPDLTLADVLKRASEVSKTVSDALALMSLAARPAFAEIGVKRVDLATIRAQVSELAAALLMIEKGLDS